MDSNFSRGVRGNATPRTADADADAENQKDTLLIPPVRNALSAPTTHLNSVTLSSISTDNLDRGALSVLNDGRRRTTDVPEIMHALCGWPPVNTYIASMRL